MNIKAYIESMNNLNLTVKEFIENGWSRELAKEDSLRFTLPIKSDNFDESGPIVSLIRNCDTSHFRVFSFTFDEINEIGPYVIFGNRDADYLGIYKETDEIHRLLYTNIMEFEMGELEKIEDVLPASTGQQEYLKALYHAAELSRELSKGDVTLDDESTVKKYVDRCASTAGGDRYYDFWNIFINS